MSDKLVLVVEDHRPNARLLGLLVQRCGVTAQMASNGAEALLAMQAQRPDLILLDLMMPIMTGNELLEVMRADAELANHPRGHRHNGGRASCRHALRLAIYPQAL
jgi:CheY-like chemotaxis protein